MSDIESDSDNEAEFIKLPKSFQANNDNPHQAFMNIVTPEQELKPNTNQDAVDSDKMAPRDVAGLKDKMAPQNNAEAVGTISQHMSREIADILAVRKSAIDAHNMASKNVAYDGGLLFKWNVESAYNQMVAARAAYNGDGSATQGNFLRRAVPPQLGATARSTAQVRKMVAASGYKMAADTENDLSADTGNKIAADTENNLSADTGNKMAADTGNKMAADTENNLSADTKNNLSADTGNKMAADTGNNMAAGCGPKTVPSDGNKLVSAPQRGNTGGCYEVRMGSQGVRWLQEGSMVYSAQSNGRAVYVNARRPTVRPPLWRVTLQAVLFMTLSICLTYFAVYFMERFMRADH